MAQTVRQYAQLVTGTSGGLTITNVLKHIDDAATVTIVITSSAGGAIYQPMVSFFDPDANSTQQMGGFVSTSTFAPGFYPIQAQITSSLASSGRLSIFPGNVMALPSIGMNQLTILCTGNDTQGTFIGYVVKTINV